MADRGVGRVLRPATVAVRAGQEPDPLTGALVTPIFQTSTYRQHDIGVHEGYDYARGGNPTRTALERNLAALEGARHGLCYSSGMAAISAVTHVLESGDWVLLGDDVYGGTYRLFARVLDSFDIRFRQVGAEDPDSVAALLERAAADGELPRFILLESPTNPLMKVVDLRAVAAIGRKHGVPLAVDNTFASPMLQRPIDLGAWASLHSTTKYLGGHSDLVGGALLTSDDRLAERAKFIQMSVGAVPGPFDCWLTLRGTKTLAVRMVRHSRNGQAVAEFLDGHPAVERVHYPGLPDHPGHAIAKRQMTGFGGMLSFELRGGIPAARRVLKATRVFTLAESLGGVESLIEHPPLMTHASIPAPEREAHGIRDGLVRLSVGIEDGADLVADLRQALAKA